MVNYPDLSSLSSNPDIGGFLSVPTAGYPYFWLWIFFGIWAIMTLTMYFKDKEKQGKERILSSASVSSFTIILLAVTGTIIGFVTLETMLYVIVFSFTLMGIWFFSTR